MRRNPIKRAFPSTLRARLLLLLALALIPALIFISIITVRARQTVIEDINATTRQLAELAVGGQEQLIARVRQLLVTLAHLPEVRAGDVNACSGLLARLLAQHPTYINFGVIDLDGHVRCSALPVEQSVDVADRDYFQQALQSADLSIGVYQIGRITDLPSINFGYPVIDENGHIQAVVYAAFGLEMMQQVVANVHLHDGATLTLVDRHGTILARLPDSGSWSGQTLPDDGIVAAMLASPVSQTLETTGVDEVARLYTYVPVTIGSEAGLYVAVGIPAAVAAAEVQRLLLTNLIALGLVVALALAAIWWGGERFILRPLRVLLHTTRRLSAGELDARTDLTGGPEEIRHLAQAFDTMAATLAQRQHQLQQAAETLAHQNQRLTTLHAIDRAILTSQSPDSTARTALEVVQRQVFAFRTSLTLFDFEKGEGSIFILATTAQTQWPEGSRFPLATFPDEYFDTLRRGDILVVADVAALEKPPRGLQSLLAEGLRSHIWIPLLIDNDLLGSFNLASDRPDAFTEEQIIIAREVAAQLAIALQQARLRQKIQQYTHELEARIAERTAQLQHTKDRVEAILNNSSDAILLLHADGSIQQTNPAFNTMFGYEPDELFRHWLASLVPTTDAEALVQTLQAVVDSGQPDRLEVTACRKDGSTFVADLVLAPIHQRDAPVEDVIVSLRDISVRKRVEQELRHALEQEKQLNELKSRFASMVSHEFRTPLTIIMSAGELLERYHDRMSEDRKQEHLAKIRLQVQQLVELLDDVLSLSRADTVGLDFQPQPVDLEAVCRELVTNARLTSRQHDIRLSVEGTCSEVRVDARLLQQAISNLLSNAIKYSPEGGSIYFDLACAPEGVMIRVRDHGIGIPEEDQQRLFEVFHRAHNVGSISGTGLGLAIVKRAVEAHNGSITFDSQVGVGSTFIIELPAAPHRS